MDPQIYIDILIGIAVIGFIAYRQISWSRVNPRKLMMLPAVLAAVGLYNLKDVVGGQVSFSLIDLWFILGQTVAAVAIGLVMGRVTKFKTTDAGTFSSAGLVGAGLWIAFIAVRLGLDTLAHVSGAHLAASIGIILLTVAVNRFTQNALVLARYRAHSVSEAPLPLAGIR